MSSKSFQTNKPERIHHQQTCTTKKKKKSSFRQKENVTREKYGSTQGMKSTRNANHLGTSIRVLFLLFMYF